jgi:hypothetical protein
MTGPISLAAPAVVDVSPNVASNGTSGRKGGEAEPANERPATGCIGYRVAPDPRCCSIAGLLCFRGYLLRGVGFATPGPVGRTGVWFGRFGRFGTRAGCGIVGRTGTGTDGPRLGLVITRPGLGLAGVAGVTFGVGVAMVICLLLVGWVMRVRMCGARWPPQPRPRPARSTRHAGQQWRQCRQRQRR